MLLCESVPILTLLLSMFYLVAILYLNTYVINVLFLCDSVLVFFVGSVVWMTCGYRVYMYLILSLI